MCTTPEKESEALALTVSETTSYTYDSAGVCYVAFVSIDASRVYLGMLAWVLNEIDARIWLHVWKFYSLRVKVHP